LGAFGAAKAGEVRKVRPSKAAQMLSFFMRLRLSYANLIENEQELASDIQQ
jgi:hypothetical protein